MRCSKGSCFAFWPAVFLLLANATLPGRLEAQPAVAGNRLEDVVAAWQAQQESMPRVRAVWRQTRTRSAELLAEIGGSPNADMKSELMFQDEVAILIDTQTTANPKGANGEEAHTVVDTTVWRNGTETRLTKYTPPSKENDHAFVKKAPVAEAVQRVSLYPIICGLRPMAFLAFLRTDEAPVEIAGNAKVDSRECLVLKCKSFFLTMYLDKVRNYMPLRIEMGAVENAQIRMRVSLRECFKSVWCADFWTMEQVSPKGTQLEKSTFVVESLTRDESIENDRIGSLLQPGTRVYDETSGRLMQYVIRDNGRPGITVPNSAHPSHEQLVRLNQENPDRTWVRPVVFMVALAIGVSVIALMIARRKKKAVVQ